MNIRHIMVPVDFSSCGLRVTRQAAKLARQLGARLTVVHVAELPVGLPPETRLTPDGAAIGAEAFVDREVGVLLDRYLAAVRDLGVQAHELIVHGSVVAALCEAATAQQADLLVMGTHGRGGIARAMLGSVAEETARKSPVPVLLIRREHGPECAAGSCNWCTEGAQAESEALVAAEKDG